jgi:hypothetical protein
MECRVEGSRTGDQWRLTLVCIDGAAESFKDRTLKVVNGPGGEFPFPLDGEEKDWAAGGYAEIAGIYRRILDNEPQPGEVAAFGRYLAAMLLGPYLEALEKHTGVVDLRIRLNDRLLERLPWEMMHSASGPLAARAGHRLSITREIGAGASATLDLPLPLKVLFVVGATIDPVLRPGAEFLGLLRHLRIPTDATFTQFRNANAHIRYLGDADIDALKDACHTFAPSVVHFICHGERDPETRETRIVLKKVVPQPGQRVTERLPLTSGELMDAFVEAGHVPPVVVLNACYAGGANGDQPVSDDGHLPFAADLVKRGVDVAVGMAGEVDDRACQLFALRFYQALLAKEPLTDATSQARRTVLAGWPEYQQSVEWARPTLFVREGLNPKISTSSASTVPIIDLAPRFRVAGKAPEMLCDRYEVLAAAQALFQMAERPGNEQMLAAIRVNADSKGVGKTRILEEIAIRSVFDRFVPVVIRGDIEPPQTFLEFALAMSDAMEETRKHLSLSEVLRTNARTAAFRVAGIPTDISNKDFKLQRYALRDKLRSLSPPGGKFELGLVRDAIRDDCAELAGEVEIGTGVVYRVLILIDEFHRYAGVLGTILENIDYEGLGTSAAPIPVVINYVDTGQEGGDIRQKLQHLPLERRVDLKRFENELERELVYRQLIASAFHVVPNQKRDKKAAVEKFFKKLHATTGGRPIEFTTPNVQHFMEGATVGDTLVDANYEDLLKQYGGR